MYQIWGCRNIDLQWYLGGGRTPFTEQSENTVFAKQLAPRFILLLPKNQLTLMPSAVYIHPLSPQLGKKHRQRQLLALLASCLTALFPRPFPSFTD